MSSVRVPNRLLERLHEATPQGVSIAKAIERALDRAGGPEAVRRELEDEDERARARARIARLRQTGHRSVVVDPEHQVALAGAARRWCELLEERGLRRYDADQRRLWYARGPLGRGQTSPEKMTLRRGGEDLL